MEQEKERKEVEMREKEENDIKENCNLREKRNSLKMGLSASACRKNKDH